MSIIKYLPRPVIHQSGFSLLEVLISLVLIAIGLLGLVGMQATSLQQNLSASQRSLASQLAYDIADRMRLNDASTALVTYITGDSTAFTTAYPNCLNGTGCGSVNMANNDLFEWNQALSNVATLPMAKGSISRPIGGQDMFLVTIQWDDNRDGVVDNDDPAFETHIHP